MTTPLPTQPNTPKTSVWSRERELQHINDLMEEMANQPKEEMGKRQPGEKCAYEIKR
jgi:hypothetical protein